MLWDLIYNVGFKVIPPLCGLIVYRYYIRRSGWRIPVQILATLVLMIALSKFTFLKLLFGSYAAPDCAEAVIWLWNFAYSGAVVMIPLTILGGWIPREVRNWMLPIAAWTIAAIGVWNGVKAPVVNEVELQYPELPAGLNGYRIVHISDTHISTAARRWRTEEIVRRVNAIAADLVLMTGDIVDGSVAQTREFVEPMKDLRAKDGVYFVTGNHEFYFDYDGWMKQFADWGFKFLGNECVFPRAQLAIGGTDDIRTYVRVPKLSTPDLKKTFATATNGEFRVLMQHRPQNARENISQHGVKLQLSGHTHGGVFPGMKKLVGWANDGFTYGLYEIGDGKLYVSSGTGQWAGFPVRFCNPSEIAVITLRGK